MIAFVVSLFSHVNQVQTNLHQARELSSPSADWKVFFSMFAKDVEILVNFGNGNQLMSLKIVWMDNSNNTDAGTMDVRIEI